MFFIERINTKIELNLELTDFHTQTTFNLTPNRININI